MSKVPYAEMLGRRDPLEVIAETPMRLAKILDGMSEEQIEARPAPGKWCVREVMAHLADCEIVWGWRLRQAWSEEHAVIQPFDQDAWSRGYGAYSVAEALGCLKALRAWNVAFVGGLKETDWERRYTHPERGEETLRTLVQIMAGHDLHHLKGLGDK